MPNTTNMKQLETVEQVLKALGPVREVMRLTGAQNYQTIHNWKDRKVFPSNLFLAMTEELERRGCRAPASLWQQVDPSPALETPRAAHAAPAG